jgi:phosphoribosylcarboxyaminoimidazole (NCAIR) mutase
MRFCLLCLLAAQIIGAGDSEVRSRIRQYKDGLRDQVMAKVKALDT